VTRRRTAIVAAAAFLAFLLVLAGREVRYRGFVARPFPTGPTRTIPVEIPFGTPLSGIARSLVAAGVVADARMFRRLAESRGASGRLQAGEYEFRTPVPPGEVLQAIAEGRVVVRAFTVPEGRDLRAIADLVAKTGIAGAEAFLERARASETAAALGVPGGTLEGFLFPETYRYRRSTTLDALLRTMTARFFVVFGTAMRDRAREVGLSTLQVVTLASIVEKETGRADERPRIAAVYLNRLRRGMPLQADPTVIYGIPGFDGDLRRADLLAPTPYNTYVNPGLPPGPICSPGEASLRAVLWPAPGADLYFVARGDGSHVFSRTYAEHREAVRRFQQGGRGT
jgi:UPF0755 protein